MPDFSLVTRAAACVAGPALLCLSACAAAGTDAQSDALWISHAGGEGPGRGKRVVLIAGDEEYRSEEALPMLARLLSGRHGFDTTVLFALDPVTGTIAPDEQTHIPGLHLVADADLVVLFLRFRELPDESMRHLVQYVERGGPLVALRTSTHAFMYERHPESPFAHWDWRSESWPGGFGRHVLGETWVAHHGAHGSESTRGRVHAAHANHPVLRGVTDVWGPTDVYAVTDLPPDADVLLDGVVLAGMQPDSPPVLGPKNEPCMPIAWAREAVPGRGRVVCSTIGASVDLESEDLRRLLVNACYWATGLEDRIPARSDARLVGEYAPTPFGFGGATLGKRPSDVR